MLRLIAGFLFLILRPHLYIILSFGVLNFFLNVPVESILRCVHLILMHSNFYRIDVFMWICLSVYIHNGVSKCVRRQ